MLYRVPAEISAMYYTEMNYDTKPLIIFMQIEDSLFSSWESFQLLCSKIAMPQQISSVGAKTWQFFPFLSVKDPRHEAVGQAEL